MPDFGRLILSMMLFIRTRSPFSAEIWLRHFHLVISLVASETDISEIIKLFKIVAKGFFNIEVALKLASLTSLVQCSDVQAQEIWNLLIPAYEFNKGREIWALYRADILRREPDSANRSERIFKIFLEELAIPLAEREKTFQEFEKFNFTHIIDRNIETIQNEFQKASQDVLALKPFEDTIKNSMDAINQVKDIVANENYTEDRKKHVTEILENQIFETFCNYINYYTSNHVFPSEGIMILYERMIATCTSRPLATTSYLEFLLKFIGTDLNSSNEICGSIARVIDRGIRQSQTVGQEIQSTILNFLLLFTKTSQDHHQDIMVLAQNHISRSSEDLVANIIFAFWISFTNNEDSIESKIDMSLQFFVDVNGQSKNLEYKINEIYLRYIAHCTGNNILPPEKIRNLYERLIELCPSQITSWTSYLLFLFNLIGSTLNTSQFCAVLSEVIGRGMQQSQSVLQAIESTVLGALIHCTMTPQVECREVLQLSRKLPRENCEELVSSIIVAHLYCLNKFINYNSSEDVKFVQTFNMSWRLFVAIHGISEKDAQKRSELSEKVTNYLFPNTNKRKPPLEKVDLLSNKLRRL